MDTLPDISSQMIDDDISLLTSKDRVNYDRQPLPTLTESSDLSIINSGIYCKPLLSSHGETFDSMDGDSLFPSNDGTISTSIGSMLTTSQPSWSCYCLVLLKNKKPVNNTYIGATIDLDRRLKRHNCELSGGAKATTRLVNSIAKWSRICSVSGFPDRRAALQFEWKWKNLSRQKEYRSLNSVDRRLAALKKLLTLERPTSKAIPFSEYPGGKLVIQMGGGVDTPPITPPISLGRSIPP